MEIIQATFQLIILIFALFQLQPTYKIRAMAAITLIFRRALLVPSGLFAISSGFITFHYANKIFSSFCSPNSFGLVERTYNSGYLCTAGWYPSAETLTVLLGAAVASALFVLLPALIEPVEKNLAAVIAYALGAAFSFPLLVISLFEPAAVLPSLVLLCVGLGSVLWVRQWPKNSKG